MELIAGDLEIDDLNSFLNTNQTSFWLLRSGFLNSNQAAAAATNYIINVQHLEEGPVIVTGTKSAIGTQPIIVMSDINAAGHLANHATFPNLESDKFDLGAALALAPKPNPKPKKKPGKKKAKAAKKSNT